VKNAKHLSCRRPYHVSFAMMTPESLPTSAPWGQIASPITPRPSYFQLDAELVAIRSLQASNQLSAALAALERLEPRYPESGRLRQAMGQVQLAIGNRAAAISAYRRAVHANDALAESWSALQMLYRHNGQHHEADEAARCIARLGQLPGELAQASFLLNEGEIDAADQICRQYLRNTGAHVEGMRILAQICIKANVLDDAELLLENILTSRPDYDEARFEYASVLAQRRRFALALHEIRSLLTRSPDNPVFRKLYALICDGLGQSSKALWVYRKLAHEAPQDTDLLVRMAHILMSCGDTEAAVHLFKAAMHSQATLAAAHLALSHIRSYSFTDQEISGMRRAEASPEASLADRYQLCFALGGALEERSQLEESFRYYARGNALKRSEIKSDPETVIQTMRRQTLTCTAEFFAARRGFGCLRPDPIFIVGLPRSGSTLLEQILASHSQIDGTMELPDIPRLVHQFRNRGAAESPRYPAILAKLTPEESARLGETYIEDTRAHRKGAPFFIDKTPNNFRDIGFIHLILPHARIIDARREPLACCFGNFKQLFASGMEFNYSFEEIGRYYCSYVALMEHWDSVLPGKILRVRHEDVVDDLEGSVRRMLEFLGLPFEDACLDFHETARTVRTLSCDQVRRPINREGLHQWRHFEPWLDPLKAALAPLSKGGMHGEAPGQGLLTIAGAAQPRPNNPSGHANRGNALKELRRDDDAIACLNSALARSPDFAAALHSRAISQLHQGRTEMAVRSLYEALQLAPTSANVHSDLGVALERLGRQEEALRHFEHATALDPNAPEAHHNRGLLEAALGRPQQALTSLDRALALQPRHPAIHANRGNVLSDLGRETEAIASFDRALQLRPQDAAVLRSRGRLLMRLRKPAAALESLAAVATLEPRNLDAHFHLGMALALLERHQEALTSFDRALAIEPASAQLLNNRGVALGHLDRPGEAIISFAKALAHEPDNLQALTNAANTLTTLGRYSEALQHFDRALAINPLESEIAWGKGRLLLTLGNYKQGWPLYESRLQLPRLRPLQRHEGLPRWTGEEPVAGKTLLVHAEQGLGDTLQFCRFVARLEARGATVIFEVQPALRKLLRSLAIKGDIVACGDRLPRFDLRTPLLSLPLLLGTELHSIPNEVPYLRADPDLISHWKARLAALPGLKAGLAWQGNVDTEKQEGFRGRSFPLGAAAPLARVAGVTLISLQKGEGSEQRNRVAFGAHILELTEPSNMGPDEILDTVALMAALDVIITSDTATAHLAGSLGLPVWVVLNASADWRWLIDRDDSPWYPTMRLFRQSTSGDWDEVFQRVARALAALWDGQHSS
jgi:tetratricopeptide (TPR) repeat protein